VAEFPIDALTLISRKSQVSAQQHWHKMYVDLLKHVANYHCCQWMRCATQQSVTLIKLPLHTPCSIPDGVIGIFHWHNPSGCTMALGSTQSLTEMSIGNISWGWRRPVRTADNLTTFTCRLSWNLGASTPWNPQGLSRPVIGLLYLNVSWRHTRRMEV